MLDPTNWQTPHAAARMAERRVTDYPLARDTANNAAVGLSKLVIFGLTPICLIAWLVTR